MPEITVEVSPWRLTWRGGRLGDVSHIEYPGLPVDALQVGAWDHQADRFYREPDRGALMLVLAEWVKDYGADYARELPFLR